MINRNEVAASILSIAGATKPYSTDLKHGAEPTR
jgi:hypothetical protein